MADKKRLLYIVYELGNIQVGLKLAAHARETGDFDMVMWSPYGLPDTPKHQADALALGSVYIPETTSDGGLADTATPLSGWLSAKPPRLPISMQHCGGAAADGVGSACPNDAALAVMARLAQLEQLEVLREFDRIERRIRFCEDWLVRLGIDAVVFAEDNVERDSHGWIWAAKRRGIKTLVVSYGSLSAQEAVTAYCGSAVHAVDETKADLIRRHLPQWLAQGDGYAITRLPFVQALARELAGVAPFNPWLVNTGRVDAIALESAAMERAYLEFGFPPGRLKPIGHPLQDRLWQAQAERAARRSALFAKHRLAADRELAVVAMPPDQQSVRPSAYRNYADLVAAYARLPSELAGLNVVICPHPNTSVADRHLMRATGLPVEELSAADLLPLADVYIACVSSTIKWALGLGVPVIDYDCYGYHYIDYVNLPQVISARDEATFRSALLQFSNLNEREILKNMAKKNAAEWGVFDGKSMERLIKLCFDEELD